LAMSVNYFWADRSLVDNLPPISSSERPVFAGDIIIDMKEMAGSGESGRVALTFLGEKTKISLLLDGAPYGALQPAHIHKGTCDVIGEELVYKLTFPATGSSDSMIEASLDELRAQGPLVIDVHKSFSDDKTVVSCGEIDL